jgi:hypothetical protein
LLLEPDENPDAKAFKAALFTQGTPMASYFVDDMRKEFERLKQVGVVFTMEPTQVGPTTVAIFDDTCGNLIQLTQVYSPPRWAAYHRRIALTLPERWDTMGSRSC